MDNEAAVLVPSAAEDFEAYYEIRCGAPDIYWMGYTSGPDKDAIRDIFMERLGSVNLAQEGSRKIFMLKVGESITGWLMLSNLPDGVEVGISLAEDWLGRGLGTEAVGLIKPYAAELGKVVYAQIRDDNVASQRIFLKNGFERTDSYVVKKYPGAGEVKFRRYEYR